MTQTKIHFDHNGFLTEPERWCKELAAAIALRDGLDVLTPDHWEVIWTLRNLYRKHGTCPDFEQVCTLTHLENHCIDHLFQSPDEAWRIAGLPDPDRDPAGAASPGSASTQA